jgi:hypothetical protein
MFTKQELKEKLEKNNRFLDIGTIEVCLKNWKIDPVYEDENNVEYFDKMALAKLNQGLILQEQGSSDEQILMVLSKGVQKTSTSIQSLSKIRERKLKGITVDLTSQTLMVLAESVAQKISSDITDKFKDNNILQSTLDMGKLQRDNEILAGQVKKLIEENKKLNTRVNLLLQEKSKFKKAFGSFYFKQE